MLTAKLASAGFADCLQSFSMMTRGARIACPKQMHIAYRAAFIHRNYKQQPIARSKSVPIFVGEGLAPPATTAHYRTNGNRAASVGDGASTSRKQTHTTAQTASPKSGTSKPVPYKRTSIATHPSAVILSVLSATAAQNTTGQQAESPRSPTGDCVFDAVGSRGAVCSHYPASFTHYI